MKLLAPRQPAFTADSACSDLSLAYEQDGIFTVKGSFQTSLPVSAIWDVITDYNGLSRVYSSVEACFTETLDNRLVVVQVSCMLSSCRGLSRPLAVHAWWPAIEGCKPNSGNLVQHFLQAEQPLPAQSCTCLLLCILRWHL